MRIILINITIKHFKLLFETKTTLVDIFDGLDISYIYIYAPATNACCVKLFEYSFAIIYIINVLKTMSTKKVRFRPWDDDGKTPIHYHIRIKP